MAAFRRGRLVVATAAGFALTASLLAPAASAAPTPAPTSPKATTTAVRGDVREVKPGTTYSTKELDLESRSRTQRKAQQKRRRPGVTPPVGTVRQWLGRDDAQGTLYRKDYVLRGVGDKIEVWVAIDLSFPAGDCRSSPS